MKIYIHTVTDIFEVQTFLQIKICQAIKASYNTYLNNYKDF